jgi:hypothetical protein
VRPGRWRRALRTLALGCAVAGLALCGPAAAQTPPGPGQEPAAVDRESLLQRQPQLMERALAGLQATAPGQPPQLFFISFAGYGPEAVFKREALAVRDLFVERFGTEGRSLVLVNHASTLDDIPLASAPNLGRALRRIGGLMDRDNDVLFLFLTSHGQKGLFVVEIPGYGADDLTPARLKALLDRSGIKNRVVVLSACHSGSFIPALAGPTTLVIAAAHAERSSFGCEDRREWTYFGDAYFNRALRRERSFERAFVLARQTIGRWEARERLDRSYPQIAGGSALRQRLDGYARRMAGQE